MFDLEASRFGGQYALFGFDSSNIDSRNYDLAISLGTTSRGTQLPVHLRQYYLTVEDFGRTPGEVPNTDDFVVVLKGTERDYLTGRIGDDTRALSADASYRLAAGAYFGARQVGDGDLDFSSIQGLDQADIARVSVSNVEKSTATEYVDTANIFEVRITDSGHELWVRQGAKITHNADFDDVFLVHLNIEDNDGTSHDYTARIYITPEPEPEPDSTSPTAPPETTIEALPESETLPQADDAYSTLSVDFRALNVGIPIRNSTSSVAP